MNRTTKPLIFTPFKLSPHGMWDGIDNIAQATVAAEQLGFYAINIGGDHIILPHAPTDPPIVDEVWYDNFVLASHLATLTKTIRFLFFVMIVPYRPPIQTAKLLATLDVVSQGRVTLGAGVGWMKGEFELLGVPFEERGRITDETLKAFRALWTEAHPEFHGTVVDFSNNRFEPKPVQKPHIPFWIGGMGPAARRRCVEFGDGWMPMGGGSTETQEFHDAANEVEVIKEMLQKAGRNPDEFNFSFSLAIGEQRPYTPHPTAATDDRMGPAARPARSVAAPATQHRPGPLPFEPNLVIDQVGRLRDAGFNHIYTRLGFSSAAEIIKHMEWFSSKVMPAFKGEMSAPAATP